MNSRIETIKKMVKKECSLSHQEIIRKWFYKDHLLTVEKFSKELLEKLPKADREMVLLGVWLHDLQRIRGIAGDHQKIGAREAEKVMEEFGYSRETIDKVKSIILTHSCQGKDMPRSLEGRILASADAMSHYLNDFYIKIAMLNDQTPEEFKKWALEKIDRDYNVKIFFPFAKKIIKDRHNALKKLLTMG